MECGKKIGTLEGYNHEVYGKRWIFCSECYSKIGDKDSIISNKMREENIKRENLK
jgi:hypothetical protein